MKKVFIFIIALFTSFAFAQTHVSWKEGNGKFFLCSEILTENLDTINEYHEDAKYVIAAYDLVGQIYILSFYNYEDARRFQSNYSTVFLKHLQGLPYEDSAFYLDGFLFLARGEIKDVQFKYFEEEDLVVKIAYCSPRKLKSKEGENE